MSIGPQGRNISELPFEKWIFCLILVCSISGEAPPHNNDVRWPVVTLNKRPVIQKYFHIMTSSRKTKHLQRSAMRFPLHGWMSANTSIAPHYRNVFRRHLQGLHVPAETFSHKACPKEPWRWQVSCKHGAEQTTWLRLRRRGESSYRNNLYYLY